MTKAELIEKYGIEWYEAHKVKAKFYYKERCINDTEYRETRNAKDKFRRENDAKYAMNRRIRKTIYRYCRRGEESKIENYELAKADNFKGWCIHHRLELTLEGDFAHTMEDLIRLDMYYNRPYFELIFLRHNDHAKLHKGSYETK